MQYTGALLITEVIKEIGENSTDTNYRLFTLNWFQEAFDIMVNQLRDSNFLNVVENLSTVASTNGYGVTNGELIQGNIIGVRNKTNNYALTYMDIFEIKRSNWDLEATGTPKYYYQYGYDLTKKSSLIYFYPIPNNTYELEVSYKIQSYLFADDSTVVRIPRYLTSPLRFYVKAMACAREGEENQSQAYLQLFYKQIEDIKRTRATIADELELQISDVPYQYYNKRNRQVYNWDSIGGGSASRGIGSIAISVPSYMGTSGSPLTADGTITLSFNSQSGRKFFASPSDGSSGAMSMRAIVVDDLPATVLTSSSSAGSFPTLNQNTTGNAATATLASDVNDNVSIQKVEVVKNSGAVVGTRKQLNFIEGSNVTLTVSDDAGNDQVDITIASSGGGGGISGLTTGTIPKAASSTSLNDSCVIQSSTNLIGINRTPSYALHVNGESRFVNSSGDGIQITDNGSQALISALTSANNARDIRILGQTIALYSGSSYTLRFTVDSNGYFVGVSGSRIGVARTPSYPLHVEGECRIVGSSSHGIQLIDDNSNSYISALTSGNGSRNLYIGAETLYLRSGTSYANTMILDTSRNVTFVGNIKLNGSTSGTTTVATPATTTSYTLTLPSSAPASNGRYLSGNTDGTTSWATLPGSLLSKQIGSGSTSNTTTETTLFTYSLSGNTLASNGDYIEIDCIYTISNTSGSSNDFTSRLKFGSSTLTDLTTIAGGGGTQLIHLKGKLVRESSSLGTMLLEFISTVDGTTTTGTTTVKGCGTYNVSIDLTTSKTISVTCQNSTANASIQFSPKTFDIRLFQ